MVSKYSLRELPQRKKIAKSIIEPLLKGKRDHSLVKIYDRIAPGPNGRNTTVLNPDTSTFRFSSSESDLFPNSTNWQNIPNKVAALDPLYRVRDCVIPDENMVFTALDYSGAEAILAAAYSRDWEFLDKLLTGADVHAETAQLFYDISAAEWEAKGGKSNPELKSKRNVAKNTRYASLYSAGVRTIAETINRDSHITGVRVTETEVTKYRAILLQRHPLERWWREVADELTRNNNSTRNCFGYRRIFHSPDPLRDALSNYPQSTVAWLQNQVIIDLEDIPYSGELLLQIHDELFFQNYPFSTFELATLVKRLMERPFTIHGRELHIPVEVKSGPRWGAMKEIAC